MVTRAAQGNCAATVSVSLFSMTPTTVVHAIQPVVRANRVALERAPKRTTLALTVELAATFVQAVSRAVAEAAKTYNKISPTAELVELHARLVKVVVEGNVWDSTQTISTVAPVATYAKQETLVVMGVVSIS